MAVLRHVLSTALVICCLLPLGHNTCIEQGSASFCGGDISASVKLTLTDEPILAVPIRKRSPYTIAPTTVAPTTVATTESTTPSTTTEDFEHFLLHFTYPDDSDEYTHEKDVFDEREKTREQEEAERLAKERDEYERKYCADQEGDIETTNLEHTGFNVPPNYEVFPGVGIYRFHRAPLPWEAARRQCEKEGAHLLVLNSEDEWTVVRDLMRRCPQLLDTHFNYYSYIGVHDMREEGRFETVLGGRLEDTGYVKWMPNQPDNAHHQGENCISVSRDGAFNDVPCYTSLPYVCEHDTFS